MQVVGLMSNGGYNEECRFYMDVHLWIGSSCGLWSANQNRKSSSNYRPNCRLNLGLWCFHRVVRRRFIHLSVVLMLWCFVPTLLAVLPCFAVLYERLEIE